MLLFNYLFSNGDAHLKNFSLLETAMGDYRLSPAYDLLNNRIHIQDQDFGLEEGLLPRDMAKGSIAAQFGILAEKAGIKKKFFEDMAGRMLVKSEEVEHLIAASFLEEGTKQNYLQAYQGRVGQMRKG